MPISDPYPIHNRTSTSVVSTLGALSHLIIIMTEGGSKCYHPYYIDEEVMAQGG
jgi:hypothetical protein